MPVMILITGIETRRLCECLQQATGSANSSYLEPINWIIIPTLTQRSPDYLQTPSGFKNYADAIS